MTFIWTVTLTGVAMVLYGGLGWLLLDPQAYGPGEPAIFVWAWIAGLLLGLLGLGVGFCVLG